MIYVFVDSISFIKTRRRTRDTTSGWYHPMPLLSASGEKSDAHSLYGPRENYPFVSSKVLPNLWDEFYSIYEKRFGTRESMLHGKKVWDIGPAEGLFTLRAIEYGASRVGIVQPKGIILQRFEKYFADAGSLSKIEIVRGLYPKKKPSFKPDVILFCGVLYHLDNIEDSLRNLLRLRSIIFLETTIDTNEKSYFNPRRHRDGYSKNTTVHLNWLIKLITNESYQIHPTLTYNSLVSRKESFKETFSDRHGTASIRRWGAVLIPEQVKDESLNGG